MDEKTKYVILAAFIIVLAVAWVNFAVPELSEDLSEGAQADGTSKLSGEVKFKILEKPINTHIVS